MELAPEEEAALQAFMGEGSFQEPRTIADIILAKIREREESQIEGYALLSFNP